MLAADNAVPRSELEHACVSILELVIQVVGGLTIPQILPAKRKFVNIYLLVLAISHKLLVTAHHAQICLLQWLLARIYARVTIFYASDIKPTALSDDLF